MTDTPLLNLLRSKNFVDAKVEVTQMLNAKAYDAMNRHKDTVAATYNTPKE